MPQKRFGLWEMSTVTAGCWYPKYCMPFRPKSNCGGSSVSNGRVSEGDILKLMECLGKEVDGALAAQKIHRETLDHPSYIPSAAVLHVNSKQPRSGRKDRHTGNLSACFVSQRVTGHKNAR